MSVLGLEFLSTLSLRRATLDERAHDQLAPISIHALLAESDAIAANPIFPVRDFYPRSPCGERPPRCRRHLKAPKFLSTLSLRRATRISKNLMTCLIFLSTLSLRRATGIPVIFLGDNAISIHALLAESDDVVSDTDKLYYVFLSTLSLRRATVLALCSCGGAFDFYPRSPCGERH